MGRTSGRAVGVGAVALLVALTGCAEQQAPQRAGHASATAAPTSTPPAAAPSSEPPSSTPTPQRDEGTPVVPQGAPARPTTAWISIPAIGVHRLRVQPYRGTADDRPGTRIQNRGIAATPRGPRGGVGPGEVGNMVVTAHRTTAGKPFGRLPSLRAGDHVLVESRGKLYDYRITRTMTISFRSARDRARQSAPVPGRLGAAATEPMITLSTCATPEDFAAGNYWTDALGNPEHRIDKVGVLIDVRAR